MRSPLQDADRSLIGEQAAKWLSELADGNTEQRAAFVAWLKQSPRHVEEFLFVSATLKEFARRDSASAPDAREAAIQQLVAEALAAKGAENVVSLGEQAFAGRASSMEPAANREGDSPARERSRKWWVAAMAAAVALVAIGSLWGLQLVPRLDPDTYSTGVGEQRTIRLPDGSVVFLNARSRMQVDFSPETRDLELTEGEAVFKVEHDAARPFRVHTGDAIVQAIGTQFNVYRRSEGATVSVLEGRVRISPDRGDAALTATVTAVRLAEATSLAAGEEASIAATGKVFKRAQPDIEAAVAWRQRRLVFRAARLEDIAAEFGRYGPRRIELVDDVARNKRITGTFDADDPGSLVLFLEKLEELAVERDGGGFVVRGR